jgi:dihydropteroate synthase
MRHLIIQKDSEAVEALQRIGVDPYGIDAMAPKMQNLNVLLEGLTCRAANIIKQEMLSIGGDVAVARGSVDCSIDHTDAIVMGTRKQLRLFAEKISRQPFGLKKISQDITALLSNLDRDVFLLKTSRREIKLGERTLLMGIVNVTPDSFSDGGRFANAEEAVSHGVRLEEEGADILDVGGESSRPGADPVALDEEIRRVIPVVEALSRKVRIPISVDTTKSEVARAALEKGAEMVNDISAMQFDGSMAETVARCGAAVVLMHMRGTPRDMQQGDLAYEDLFAEIIAYLGEKIEKAQAAGIGGENILIDPGIGFGKSAEDNLRLIKRLAEFKVLGRPVLIGTSRKMFIGKVTGGSPRERLEGTAATVTAAVLNGAHVVRVHDVKFMKPVVSMTDAILRG